MKNLLLKKIYNLSNFLFTELLNDETKAKIPIPQKNTNHIKTNGL